MMQIRRAEDRGPSNFRWLKSLHTFSFGHYYDPNHMGFETLRVINDDRVAPGEGFSLHPHSDMEIVTYVLDGALEHKDSMGNGSIIRPGEVQRLTAGTGMMHSEYNHSNKDEVHFLQLWFLPEQHGVPPSYEQKAFPPHDKRGQFRLVVSKDGREGSVSINQDVDISVALVNGDETVEYQVAAQQAIWIHIARGKVSLNGRELKAGDGVAVTDEQTLKFAQGEQAEVIVISMDSTAYSH